MNMLPSKENTNEMSAGSQPVAWAVEFEGEVEPFCLSFNKSKAINEAGGVGRVFPLWRSPTLTDEEKKALTDAIEEFVEIRDKVSKNSAERYKMLAAYYESVISRLNGLLDRLK